MGRYCGPHTANSQAFTFQPLKIEGVAATVFFNSRFLCSLEGGLPGQADAVAEVAHVHHLLLLKAVANNRVKARQHFATVGNWRFAAADGRDRTVKIYF